MRLICDLHIHSHYSRATSRDLTFAGLTAGATQKGIQLMATGDALHPKWLAEMKAQLTNNGGGLYSFGQKVAGKNNVHFIVAGEIACIYSKGGKTRRQHTLFAFPSIESAERVSQALEKRGCNVRSDGRPIIGMDVKNLLALCLEIEPLTICIPAHIWTPWFSLFGSKSGFNSIQECFGDLSDYIWAVETGLSSDPAMNWRIKELNSRVIISNSDAHSTAKLGREATVLDLPELSYTALHTALKHKRGVLSTIEFFPEEGKYHADGHRACGIMLTPQESKRHQNVCPKCGLTLTIGVLNRVEELADQSAEEGRKHHPPFTNIIPLPEIIGEVFGVSANSKKVTTAYLDFIKHGQNEFHILLDASLSDLGSMTSPEIVEGIKRMRAGQVHIAPGYDGVYGTVHLFEASERKWNAAQQRLL